MPIERDALPKGYRDISHGALPKESSTQSQKNNNIRKGWTEQEKEDVRIRQRGVCNKCRKPPPRWEYHHKDGNRNNSNVSNCEGLCPNCHSVKTYD